MRNVGNALFIVVLAALLPYYTYVCACATRFAVWSVCVMCVVCVSKDGAPLQTGFGWGWNGIRIVLEELGDASNNLKYVHDAFYRVFLLVIVCRIDRDETQLLWI